MSTRKSMKSKLFYIIHIISISCVRSKFHAKECYARTMPKYSREYSLFVPCGTIECYARTVPKNAREYSLFVPCETIFLRLTSLYRQCASYFLITCWPSVIQGRHCEIFAKKSQQSRKLSKARVGGGTPMCMAIASIYISQKK